MAQGTVKTLKDDVNRLICQANPPMGPGKLDIIDEVIDEKEETWETVVVISDILEKIII